VTKIGVKKLNDKHLGWSTQYVLISILIVITNAEDAGSNMRKKEDDLCYGVMKPNWQVGWFESCPPGFERCPKKDAHPPLFKELAALIPWLWCQEFHFQ
jgi:hypothetical protein